MVHLWFFNSLFLIIIVHKGVCKENLVAVEEHFVMANLSVFLSFEVLHGSPRFLGVLWILS